jgi:hypothetical protein
MPMIFADETDARQVMGLGWTQPYAQSMNQMSQGEAEANLYQGGYGNRSRQRVSGMGMIYGLGAATAADFQRWSGIIDQYADRAAKVNNAGARASLASEYAKVKSERDNLNQFYGPNAGGSPGVVEQAQLEQFAGNRADAQTFRDHVNKAEDKYGSLAVAPGGLPSEKNKALAAGKKTGLEAEVAGLPVWAWGAIAIGGVVALKMAKVF